MRRRRAVRRRGRRPRRRSAAEAPVAAEAAVAKRRSWPLRSRATSDLADQVLLRPPARRAPGARRPPSRSPTRFSSETEKRPSIGTGPPKTPARRDDPGIAGAAGRRRERPVRPGPGPAPSRPPGGTSSRMPPGVRPGLRQAGRGDAPPGRRAGEAGRDESRRPVRVEEDDGACRPAPSPAPPPRGRHGARRTGSGGRSVRPQQRRERQEPRRLAAEDPGRQDEGLGQARRRPLGERLARAPGGRGPAGPGRAPRPRPPAARARRRRRPAARPSAARRGPRRAARRGGPGRPRTARRRAPARRPGRAGSPPRRPATGSARASREPPAAGPCRRRSAAGWPGPGSR